MGAPGLRLTAYYLLLAVFAALASYRLHLAGFEAIVGPGIQEILEGRGRAPDQYRILPYLILGACKSLLDMLTTSSETWRPAIIVFESASLFGALLILHRLATGNRHTVLILSLAMLLYPLLMMDGVRSIASFILLMSAAQLWLAQQQATAGTRLGFFLLLLIFCFTRADVALLIGLIGALLMGLSWWEKLLAAALPAAIQLVLMILVYPQAEYFSTLLMLDDNLSLRYLLANPLSYLLIAVLLLGWRQIRDFLSRLWRFSPLVPILVGAYILIVFVIGRPNEYRLFLPLLAVGLALWPIAASGQASAAPEPSSPGGTAPGS